MDISNNNYKELAEYLYNLGKHDADFHHLTLDGGKNENLIGIIPEGMKAVNLSQELPSRPQFKQEQRELVDVSSFIGYFNEQKKENSRIFAQLIRPPFTFEGIIDYHGQSVYAADWCKHRVLLLLNFTDQFRLWKDHSGSPFTQEEFAEFLKDNRFDIQTPDNAQLLELIMHLEATRECQANGSVRTNRGVSVSYTEVTSARRDGATVEVPDTLALHIPMFQGGAAVDIIADFKFRIREGRIVFSYRLLNIDGTIRAAVSAIRDRIIQETETPVYM